MSDKNAQALILLEAAYSKAGIRPTDPYEALANTQRAIIEAAERRAYERGLADARAAGAAVEADVPNDQPALGVRFGLGKAHVQTGTYGDEPCVFIGPDEKTPLARLIFPTKAQAERVADALVGEQVANAALLERFRMAVATLFKGETDADRKRTYPRYAEDLETFDEVRRALTQQRSAQVGVDDARLHRYRVVGQAYEEHRYYFPKQGYVDPAWIKTRTSEIEAALANPPAPAPAADDDESVESVCESGAPECGPVEFHDSEGVPLCRVCWEGLLADSTPASGEESK